MKKNKEKLLEDATVLIDTDNEVGTGFYILPGYLITCAHVVLDADHQVYQNIRCSSDGKTWQKAIVKEFSNPRYPDIAILNVREGSGPCLNLDTTPHIFLNTIYYSQGFQKVDRVDYTHQREPVRLTYTGPANNAEERLLKFTGDNLSPGISGAPVINDEGAVVGIIKASKDKMGNLGGDVIPVSQLIEQLRHWNLLTAINSKEHLARQQNTYRDYIYGLGSYRKRIPRYILLFVIVAALILWSQNHWGLGLTAPLSIALSVIFFMLDSDPDKRFQLEREQVGGILNKRFLSNGLLIFMGLSTLLLWLFVGTLCINAHHTDQDYLVKILNAKTEEIHSDYLQAPDRSIRFSRIITPFGKPAHIRIAGFEDLPIRLKIGPSDRIDFPTDFKQDPVLYIRLSPALFAADEQLDSSFVLITDGTDTVAYLPTRRKTGGLLVGSRFFDFRQSYSDQWELDCQDNVSPEELNDCYQFWATSMRHEPSIQFNTQTTYTASFVFYGQIETSKDTFSFVTQRERDIVL